MAKIAVVKTGGKQYVVREGDHFKVEKLAGEGSLELGEVLLVADADGSGLKLGTPRVAGSVKADVARQGRAAKIRVVHYKAKTRQHKVYGHRQPFTELKVTSFS